MPKEIFRSRRIIKKRKEGSKFLVLILIIDP